jgi:apolipoprotein N-acyltransferase
MDKSVKAFFITTAALEAGAGVAMVLFPLQAVSLLLGPDAAGPGAIPIEKVAGCALVALALLCWLARNDAQSAAARGIVWGMTIYNLGVIAVLCNFALTPVAQTQVQLQSVSMLLWPAVVLHAFMSTWCGLCLAKKPS